MVTSPGQDECAVVDAYSGRQPRTIPSSRLHEVGYYVETRRYAKSGYLRLGRVADHMRGVVRAALVAHGMSEALVESSSFSSDPVQGGTIALACSPRHPAVRTAVAALATIGRSAVLVRERDPRTVLRVRYGPGAQLCPVRWLRRDDEWTMHYCGKPLGHDDGEHQEPLTYQLLWDGDDDGLEWPGARSTSTTVSTVDAVDPINRDRDGLAVLAEALQAEDYELPSHIQQFTAQLRTTECRRRDQPGLITYGPLDQEEPDGVTTVTDGAGHRWQRRAGGQWSRADAPGPDGAADVPWYLLAFERAPLTQPLSRRPVLPAAAR